MSTRVAGLDIGSFAVRAVELTLGGVRPVLERFAQVGLPPGAVQGGEVADAAAVSAAIRRLWQEGGLRARRVVVGVASQRVILREVELPAMSEGELESALRFEAQELIPIPVDDAVLDFRITGASGGGEGEARMRVLLAGAQRDLVRRHLDVVEAGGVRPAVVDVVPVALVRALSLGAPGEGEDDARALVCVGARVTHVVVHEGGVPRFARTLLTGGDDITEAIAAQLDVSLDEAEDLKRRVATPHGDRKVHRAAQVVAERVEVIAEEVRGSLDYHFDHAHSALGRVHVTGGGSRTAGLLERLHEQLGVPVDVARPFLNVQLGAGLPHNAVDLTQLEPVIAVPLGLALAEGEAKGVRRISLVPAEIKALREQRRANVLAAGAVGGLAGLLSVVWAVKATQVAVERGRAEAAEAELAALAQQEASLRDVAALEAELARRRTQVKSLLAGDVAWTRLFHQVTNAMPHDVWLTNFSGQRSGPVTVSAVGVDHSSPARWLLGIEGVGSLTQAWVPNSTKQGQGDALVNFTGTANLTPAARSGRAHTISGEAK